MLSQDATHTQVVPVPFSGDGLRLTFLYTSPFTKAACELSVLSHRAEHYICWDGETSFNIEEHGVPREDALPPASPEFSTLCPSSIKQRMLYTQEQASNLWLGRDQLDLVNNCCRIVIKWSKLIFEQLQGSWPLCVLCLATRPGYHVSQPPFCKYVEI